MLPSAKTETIRMSDRTYEGADPVFYDTNENSGKPNIVKAAKGVPYRKITQNGEKIK